MLQVFGDFRSVAQGLLQGRVARQAVQVGQDAVEFGQHRLYRRHHRAELVHGSHGVRAKYGVLRLEQVSRILSQHKVHDDTAHERRLQRGRRTFRDAHVLVELNEHDYCRIVGVVVFDVAYRSHGIAVGIDQIRHGELLGIFQLDVVRVGGLEDVDAFQEIDSYNQYGYADDGGDGNLDFVFHGEWCLL